MVKIKHNHRIIELPKFEPKQLSEHFYSYEFQCRCRYENCRVTYIDLDLIDYLEAKRAELGGKHPIVITSGFRCTAYNRKKKGAKGSLHLIGKAADIWIPGESMIKLAHKFEDADGLGRYPEKNFLHVDIRGYHARWTDR